MPTRFHDLARTALRVVPGLMACMAPTAAAASTFPIALSVPMSIAAQTMAAYRSSPTATACEEALLWAEWVKAPDGVVVGCSCVVRVYEVSCQYGGELWMHFPKKFFEVCQSSNLAR